MKVAVALFMLLLSGCAIHGQAVPDVESRTAGVIVRVTPELQPIINTLQAQNVATSSEDLMNLALYFRVACINWQSGEFGEGQWSAQALRDDMAVNAGKHLDNMQAGLLASAFKTACTQ